jgi:hypothetical protein
MGSYTPCWFSGAVAETHLHCAIALKFKAYVYQEARSFWETGPLVKAVFSNPKESWSKLLTQVIAKMEPLCQAVGINWEDEFQPSLTMKKANLKEPNEYTRFQTTMSSEAFLLCIAHHAVTSGKMILRKRYMAILACLFQQLVVISLNQAPPNKLTIALMPLSAGIGSLHFCVLRFVVIVCHGMPLHQSFHISVGCLVLYVLCLGLVRHCCLYVVSFSG